MFVTQYRWVFDYFFGWRLVPVQVWVPYLAGAAVPVGFLSHNPYISAQQHLAAYR
jgi:hypothetical protein